MSMQNKGKPGVNFVPQYQYGGEYNYPETSATYNVPPGGVVPQGGPVRQLLNQSPAPQIPPPLPPHPYGPHDMSKQPPQRQGQHQGHQGLPPNMPNVVNPGPMNVQNAAARPPTNQPFVNSRNNTIRTMSNTRMPTPTPAPPSALATGFQSQYYMMQSPAPGVQYETGQIMLSLPPMAYPMPLFGQPRAPQPFYNPQQQQMFPRHAYPPGPAAPQQGLYMAPHTPSQPPREPVQEAPKRERKVLEIVNPETNKSIWEPDSNAGASPAAMAANGTAVTLTPPTVPSPAPSDSRSKEATPTPSHTTTAAPASAPSPAPTVAAESPAPPPAEEKPSTDPVPVEKVPEVQQQPKPAETAPVPLHIEEPLAIATLPVTQTAVPAQKEENVEASRSQSDDGTSSTKVNGEVESTASDSPDRDGRGTQRSKGRKGGKSALSPSGVSAAAPKKATAQAATPTVPEATPIPVPTAVPSPAAAAAEVSQAAAESAQRIEEPTPEAKAEEQEVAKTPDSVITPTTPVTTESVTDSDSTPLSVENGCSTTSTPAETKSSPEEQPASKSLQSTLPYAEDQWSPANPEGKKQYTRDFLMELQASAVALKRPEDLPDLEVVRGVMKAGGGGGGAGAPRRPFQKPFVDSFTPDFVAKSAGPGRGPLGKRPSQHGRDGGPGGPGGNMNMPPRRKELNVSLSLQKTKIQEVEGAWKPSYALKQAQTVDPEEAKTAELLKTVRGILNKLTPQKYDKLLEKLQQLPIDTQERLAGVIKLFFDKAVDEPIFSPAYAKMCHQMSTKQVPSSENPKEPVSFRKLLLIRCQKEFEKDGTSLVEMEEKRKQLEAEENEEKRKELEASLSEMEAKNRRVTLGNIRFIGELFKLRMLTPRIMHSCVTRLLSASDEESLECMSRLMSTIGKELEQTSSANGPSAEMNSYFAKLTEMSQDTVKYSNRIRFMIQDLLDLRRNDWKPRREDNNPKTIDQIHKEVEREREEQEYQNAMTPSQPSGPMGGGGRRGGPGGGMDDRKRSRVGSNMPPGMADDGWSTVSKGKRDDFRQLKVPSLALVSDTPDADVNLGGSKFGPAKSFGQWQQGSSGFGSSSSTASRGGVTSGPGLRPGYMSSASMGPPMEGMNRYHALVDDEGPPTFAPPKPAPFGGRASTGGGAPHGGRDYRSVGSTKSAILPDHKREGGYQRQGAGYGGHGPHQSSYGQQYPLREVQPREQAQRSSRPASRDSSVARLEFKGPASMSGEDLEKKTKGTVDEYLSSRDLKDAVLSISEKFHPKTIAGFVEQATLYKLEAKDIERRLVGGLFHELVKQKLMSKSAFVEGLNPLLSAVEDYIVDIPKLVEYIAHIVAPVFIDGTLPLSVVEEWAQPLAGTRFGAKLVLAIFKEIVGQTTCTQLLNLWSASRPQLDKFFRVGTQVEEWLRDQGFAFLIDGSASSQSTSQSSSSSSSVISLELKWKLQNVFKDIDVKDKTSEAIRLVETHLSPEQRGSPAFVRALVTIVVESALRGEGTTTKVDKEDLRSKTEILKPYIKSPKLELETLMAVQALWHARENPQAVLGVIFDVFYDENLIYEDAFRTWKDIDDPSDGKGVAVLNVTQFFTWLDEADEEDDDEPKA